MLPELQPDTRQMYMNVTNTLWVSTRRLVIIGALWGIILLVLYATRYFYQDYLYNNGLQHRDLVHYLEQAKRTATSHIHGHVKG